MYLSSSSPPPFISLTIFPFLPIRSSSPFLSLPALSFPFYTPVSPPIRSTILTPPDNRRLRWPNHNKRQFRPLLHRFWSRCPFRNNMSSLYPTIRPGLYARGGYQ